MHSPVREDRLLLKILDNALAASARLAGSRLACRPGCTACCIGPFPINMLDAWRLRQGLAELDARDPERAAQVRARALKTAAGMDRSLPEEVLSTRHADVPCPALDPDSGTCDLYAWRPLSCRTYGPAVRIGAEALPPCELCFQGAPEEEIAECCVAVDPDGVEDAILSRMEEEGAPREQTLVVFALAGDPGTGGVP